MLLRYCLVLAHILHLVYLCPCLGLDLLMPYRCDLFFIFSIIFIVVNHITSLKQTHLFLIQFLEYPLIFLDNKIDEESKRFSKGESSTLGCCIAFA